MQYVHKLTMGININDKINTILFIKWIENLGKYYANLLFRLTLSDV